MTTGDLQVIKGISWTLKLPNIDREPRRCYLIRTMNEYVYNVRPNETALRQEKAQLD